MKWRLCVGFYGSIAAVLWVAYLFASTAISGEIIETRDLHVQAKSLNLYGHWSTEHVEITLVKPNSPAEKWRVITNDWQVYPQLSTKVQRSKNKKEKAPEYLAIDQVLAMRNQMIAQSENGYDIEEIVDICIKELLKSELIRDVEHLGDDSYKVHLTNKSNKPVIGFRRLPRELREAIEEAAQNKSEITPDNWKNNSVINSFMARSMCHKMDPTRKER